MSRVFFTKRAGAEKRQRRRMRVYRWCRPLYIEEESEKNIGKARSLQNEKKGGRRSERSEKSTKAEEEKKKKKKRSGRVKRKIEWRI